MPRPRDQKGRYAPQKQDQPAMAGQQPPQEPTLSRLLNAAEVIRSSSKRIKERAY